jgi:hypothetical protein
MAQDDDNGDNRDPLLVRPFVLNDSGETIADASKETWPSNPAREARSHRPADDPEADTTVLPVPSHRRHSRRPLIVVGAIAIAVLGGISAAVAVAALRPDDRPPATSAQGDPPPLATGGPLPGTPSPAPGTPGDAATTSRTADAPADRGNGGARTTNPADEDDDRETTAPTSGPETETPPGDTGEIRGQDGVCLDLAGNAPAGTAVLVRECDDSARQRWLVASDGTLRASGRCAAASDNAVRAADCDGRAATRWTRDGQLLINAANGRCLTDPSKGTRPGTATTAAICDGDANKRWSLP